MTSFDIAVTIQELQELVEVRISKIYQSDYKVLLFKLQSKRDQLLIEAGKRFHLTKYIIQKPPYPSQFCQILRKHIQRGVIKKIEQHDFERVITLDIQKSERRYKLVIELFDIGNAILLDEDEKIIQALTYRKMRDRNILRNKKYEYPPQLRFSLTSISKQQLFSLKEQKKKVVVALTSLLGVGGLYAEEILLKADISKDVKANRLTTDEIERMYDAIIDLISKIEKKQLSPHIIYSNEGKEINVSPFTLLIYKNNKKRVYTSFNEALDDYFSKKEVKQKARLLTNDAERKLEEYQRILRQQRETIAKLKINTKKNQLIGDKIFTYLTQFENLFNSILNMRRSGIEWNKIESKFTTKKIDDIPKSRIESVNSKTGEITIKVDQVKTTLDLKKTPQQNAAIFYEKAKKEREKIVGAEKSIKKTLENLKNIKTQRNKLQATKLTPRKTRKKAWYDKFHWFYSAEDFLVIGGKDAATNEILLKRHTETNDLVFHPDFQGAPFVVIKTLNQKPSEQTLFEAAQFAASHSKAWREGLSSLDVYWVEPEQVSKQPPSGEYLPKGAFMVRGTKNYLRNVPLKITIGVIVEDDEPSLIGGPPSAIKSKSRLYFTIVPGKKTSKKTAEQIKSGLIAKASKQLGEKIKNILLSDVQRFIPAGNSSIIKY